MRTKLTVGLVLAASVAGVAPSPARSADTCSYLQASAAYLLVEMSSPQQAPEQWTRRGSDFLKYLNEVIPAARNGGCEVEPLREALDCVIKDHYPAYLIYEKEPNTARQTIGELEEIAASCAREHFAGYPSTSTKQ